MANDEINNYVKKETLLITVFICLVIGFLGGIVFSAYKAPSLNTTAQPQQQAQQQYPQSDNQGMTQEQADMILSLEKEVASNPGNEEAWVRLGHVYFDTGNYVKSIKDYTKALDINPNNADVWTDLGVMYRRNRQPDQALAAFDKAIGINPSHQIAHFNKGIVLFYDLNNRTGAIKAWEELLKINPTVKAPNGQPLKDMIAQIKTQSK